MKGVPPGYTHKWQYQGTWEETKLPSGKWAILAHFTKHRPATTYGKVPRGTQLSWNIDARQDVTKTSAGSYKIIMSGIKTYIPKTWRTPK